jgi:hypothetical protein
VLDRELITSLVASFRVRRKSRATVKFALHIIITLFGPFMSVSVNCTGVPSWATTVVSAGAAWLRVAIEDAAGWVVIVVLFWFGFAHAQAAEDPVSFTWKARKPQHTHGRRTQSYYGKNFLRTPVVELCNSEERKERKKQDREEIS